MVNHSRPDEYAGTASQALPGNPAIIAEVVRGQHVEGRHWGHAVVADISGRVLFAVGDPEHLIFPRSALKPIQALAGIVSGIDNRFRFTDAELAVICGSHRAEPRHRAAVRSILAKIGAAEEYLHCGPHPVMDIATRDELIRCGLTPTPIYNNCSGKHAGMLALAKVLGAPIDGYWNIDHPVQKTIQGICRDLCGVDDASMLDWAIDGCAVPTYLLTLRQLARGFARLCAPEHLEQNYAADCCRLSAAMMIEPEMVGGIDSRDSVLMRQLSGKVIAKGGAEGVQAIGIVGRGVGVAIKVEDGADRPLWPLCVSIMQRLGVLPESLPSDFPKAWQAEIKNTRGERVGYVRACI